MTTDPEPLLSIITVTDDPSGTAFGGTRDSLQAIGDMPEVEWLVVPAELSAVAGPANARTLPPCNDGIYPAMNAGLDAAKGAYIWFLNGGDQLAGQDALTAVLAACRDGRADFIYGDTLIERDGLPAPALKPARDHRDWHKGMFAHHQAMIYRRARIGEQRFDNRYSIASDYHFTIRHLLTAEHIVRLDLPLCRYAEGGLSEQHMALGAREQARIRRHDFAVDPWTNLRVLLWQHGSRHLRHWAPSLWFRLRHRWTG